jgi:hypothetical protein
MYFGLQIFGCLGENKKQHTLVQNIFSEIGAKT